MTQTYVSRPPLNITLEISLTMRKEGIREMIESLRESKRRLPKKVRLAVMVFPRDQDDRDICVYISDQKLNIAYHMIERLSVVTQARRIGRLTMRGWAPESRPRVHCRYPAAR